MGKVIVPSDVQPEPSAEAAPLKAFPLRAIRSQRGAAPAAVGLMPALDPGAVRYWKPVPFDGVTTLIAKEELDPRVSRIMTPALAQASVGSSEAMRATSSPSPVRG